MPPKRESVTNTTQPELKIIKVGSVSDIHDFTGGPVVYDSSPIPSNEQVEMIESDDDNLVNQGIRTDTISLLLKIEQLQAQLKYERRCRILAERELKELKEMNTLMTQMRHTAQELRVTLDHVLHGGETAVMSRNSEESITFMSDPEIQMRTIHDVEEEDSTFLYLSHDLRVPKNLYERIAEIGDYKKYVSALLMILFDRNTLGTHCLQGRKNSFTGEDSHKPALPPEILKSLMDHVADKFGVDSSLIKTAIRTKLNNEDKLLKRRLGLGKSENRVMVDQTFYQDASLLSENDAMPNDSTG